MESTRVFSLAKYANYGIVVVVIIVVLAVSANLWVMHDQSRSHDTAMAALLAQKNAQILGQWLSVDRGSVDDAALRGVLQQLFESDGDITVWDDADYIVAEIGGIDSHKSVVRAVASVADTGWRLEVSRPTSGHILTYLFEGAAIWIVLFVATAFVTLGFRALRAAASELKHVGRFLHQIDSGPFAIDPPPCEIEETARMLPAIQRIASALHKKEKTIAKLSFTDNITKLPNRLHFFERFRHAFELAKRGSDICLLVLEINEFQKTDEVLGHEYADAMLRMLAETLQHQTRKSDFAARLGTSSFAAIFYNAQADFMPARLRQLQQDFATRQKDSAVTTGEVYCTLSCAMTYVDAENDHRAEDPVSRVENALRGAKKLGGSQFVVVEPRPKDGEPLAVTASG